MRRISLLSVHSKRNKSTILHSLIPWLLFSRTDDYISKLQKLNTGRMAGASFFSHVLSAKNAHSLSFCYFRRAYFIVMVVVGF